MAGTGPAMTRGAICAGIVSHFDASYQTVKLLVEPARRRNSHRV